MPLLVFIKEGEVRVKEGVAVKEQELCVKQIPGVEESAAGPQGMILMDKPHVAVFPEMALDDISLVTCEEYEVIKALPRELTVQVLEEGDSSYRGHWLRDVLHYMREPGAEAARENYCLHKLPLKFKNRGNFNDISETL